MSQNSWASIAVVRTNSNSSSGAGSGNVTLPSNNVGDIIIVATETNGVIRSLPTDTAGNTWTLVQNNVTASWGFKMWIAQNCNASASTNTITTNDASGFARNVVIEYSGVATSGSLRTSNQNSATSTSLKGGTLSPNTGDLSVGFFFANGANLTVGSGYKIEVAPDSQSAFEDKNISNFLENPPMSGSSSVQWTGISASFVPSNSTTHYDIIQGGSSTVVKSIIN